MPDVWSKTASPVHESDEFLSIFRLSLGVVTAAVVRALMLVAFFAGRAIEIFGSSSSSSRRFLRYAIDQLLSLMKQVLEYDLRSCAMIVSFVVEKLCFYIVSIRYRCVVVSGNFDRRPSFVSQLRLLLYRSYWAQGIFTALKAY